MATSPTASGSRLSRVVIALTGVEVAILLGFIALFATSLPSGEALSRNIAQAAMVIAGVPLVAFAADAGARPQAAQRAPKTALALALLVIPVAVVFLLFA
jgi:hypothetical protein